MELVNRMLQDEALLNAIIYKYSETSNRLSPNASILNYALFEIAFVKLQTNSVSALSNKESESIGDFLEKEKNGDENEGKCNGF